MSARIIASMTLGFVLLLIISGIWFFRYAPLGSFTGNGGGVYVYDRWSGNTLWLVGNISSVVKPSQHQAAKQPDYLDKMPKLVTDPETLRQLNKVLVPEGFILENK